MGNPNNSGTTPSHCVRAVGLRRVRSTIHSQSTSQMECIGTAACNKIERLDVPIQMGEINRRFDAAQCVWMLCGSWQTRLSGTGARNATRPVWQVAGPC